MLDRCVDDNRIFQVVFTFLAIRQRNTIQIIGLVIFNASFVAYSAVQVSEIPQSVDMINYSNYEHFTKTIIVVFIFVFTNLFNQQKL